MAPNPQNVTVYGRLSYPTFSYAQAVINNAKSPTPASDPGTVSPDFNLVMDPIQGQKFLDHVTDKFFPWCLENNVNGEKKNALDAKQIARLQKVIDETLAGDTDAQPPYVPVKVISEKTAALAPDAIFSLKVKGNRGTDIVQKAIVNDESELSVPDPDILKFPVVKPLHQTVHQMQAGDYCAVTINLYSYFNGKMPGFSASSGVIVFKAEGDKFSGGVTIDEDEIFMD